MLNKLIYELTKVYVYDYAEKSRKFKIDCSSRPSGFFDSVISVEEFIRKHNHDNNCFFICRSYVFNPKHSGQTEDFLTQRTYDNTGNILCDCPTYHFVVNYNEMFGDKYGKFVGRDKCILNKGDRGWYYDEISEQLCKCEIGEIPFDTKKASEYDCLDWYDDSYLVYPMPKPQNLDNHQHIISCFIFTDEFINAMINDV